MAANYVLLEKITVGAAGASSVTFSSIPQTGYTDLVVVCSVRGTRAYVFDSAQIRFNGDTGSNYSYRDLLGEGGGTPASGSNTSRGISDRIYLVNVMPAANATASTFGSFNIYIPNYTSANYKSISVDAVGENNSSTAGDVADVLEAGLWSSTAAITSITVGAYSASMTQHSTFYLYGVAKSGTTPAIAPYATGGDVVTTDGTYWYHAFLATGTFTPRKSLSCDVLVVAGGGSGGASVGSWLTGGGGAGGLLAYTSQSLTTSSYTITIGSGGSISAGSNSQFGSLTAAVGGGAGSSTVGGNGGSGGGAGGINQTPRAGGTATSGQGNAGGANSTTDYAAGGGGGANAAGGAGSGNVGGAGGAGSSSYSSWGLATGTGQLVSGTYYYAGGGGGGDNSGSGSTSGGAGGSGGGGAGAGGFPSTGYTGTAGTANTGGGGGGNSDYSSTAPGIANGGSGLVLVRYAI